MYNPYLAYQVPRPGYAVPAPETPQMPQPYFGIKGRPVASIDEARATSIDFDGSIFYFPDLANNKIYTKQINIDGTATLNVYELKETPVAQEVQLIDTSKYVTKEELEIAIKELKEAFTPQISKKEFPTMNF